MSSTQEATNVPTDKPINGNVHFLELYRQKMRKHMPTKDTAVTVLSTKDRELFQTLAQLIEEATPEQVQYLLDRVYEDGIQYSIPSGCSRRETPKSAERLLQKLVHGGRSSFADWIACRFETDMASFPRLEQEFQDALGNDAVLVWRHDYRKEPDVVQYGYAYMPGSLAILEIQIIEPFAAWVLRNNSNHKHLGDTSYMTFKESSDLYSVLKEAILNGRKPDDPLVDDVVTYFEDKRRASGGDPSVLNKAELDKLKAIIAERFGS